MLDEISSESLTSLLTDVRSGSNHLHVYDDSLLIPGSVIEIQGGPSSGKTHLLYHLILVCIAPSVHNSISLGGRGKAAILFDMDHSLDIGRLYQLLLVRLTNSLAGDLPTANYLARHALTKLRVFHPSSTSQLAVTILHLPNYHSTHLADQEIGIVAIDSMSSQYWPDRFLAEQAGSPSTEHQRGVTIPTSPLEHVLLALGSFRHTHGPAIVMTNWGLYSIGDSDPPLYRQHLQPFPVPFPSSYFPASNFNRHPLSARHQNLLKLTSHITLHQDIMSAQPVEKSTHPTQKACTTGLIRTPNTSSVGKFTLDIDADSINVHQQSPLE